MAFKLYPGQTQGEITIRGGASFDGGGIFVPVKSGRAAKTVRTKVVASTAIHTKILNDARRAISMGTMHDYCLMAAFTVDRGVISIENADFETVAIVPKFSIERKVHAIATIANNCVKYDNVESLVISTFGLETAYIALDNFEVGFEFNNRETEAWPSFANVIEAHIAAIQFLEQIKNAAYHSGFSIGTRLIAPKCESPFTAYVLEEAIALLVNSAPKAPKTRTL